MSKCAQRIVKRSNGVFNIDDATSLIKEVDALARKRVATGEDYTKAVTDIVSKRAANVKEGLLKQKANIVRNKLIKASIENRINELVDSGVGVVDAIRAEIEGAEGKEVGLKDSYDAQSVAMRNVLVAKLYKDLASEDLVDLFSGGTLDEQVGRSLWDLSSGNKPDVKNRQAVRIAEIIRESLEAHRLELNSLGADISEVGGYIMPQKHDIYKMMDAGKDEWINFMSSLIDRERSFGGEYQSLSGVLSSAYDAMISGIRLSDPLEQDAKLFQFSGPANLGKKLSRSREIHFKDYDSWKKWNEKFGDGSFHDGIIESVDRNAVNIALMSRYGTNPQAMLEAVADSMLKKHRASIVKKGDVAAKAKVDSIIKHAVGANNLLSNTKLAKFGANIRAYNNLRLLGGVLTAVLGDIPMKSLEYKFQGKSWLESQAKAVLDIRHMFTSSRDQMRFLNQLGIVSESLAGELAGKFSSTDPLGTKMSKLQRLFFRMTGLTKWDDSHKFALIRSLSNDLGELRDASFNDLPEDIARLFGNYRINESDWDKIRQNATQLEDGRFYAASENIKDQKVARKLTAFYLDRANSGVMTSGLRERRIATLGTERGTVSGELARFVMQFKTYPLMVFTKGWSKAVYGKGKPDVPAMVSLLMGSMLYGYLATSAKDLIKGRTPKSPEKLETYFASLAQGGGLGILGDLLLVDYSYGGRDPLQVFAGPTLGAVSDFLKIISASARGEKPAGVALSTGISYIPFNNLFYTRVALDNLILTQMQEDLNPGYLRRMERNIKRTYGQELLFK